MRLLPLPDTIARAVPRWAALLAPGALLALTLGNVLSPTLRLAGHAPDYVAFVGLMGLVWYGFLRAQRTLGGWRRGLYMAAHAPALLLTLPVAACAGMNAASAALNDVSFAAPVRSVAIGRSQVTVFALDCGAGCAAGVEVRQERPVLPGLLLVRRLLVANRADDAAVVPAPWGVAVTVHSGYTRYAGPVGPQRVPLRPWVYF